jgi:hypothetical protein
MLLIRRPHGERGGTWLMAMQDTMAVGDPVRSIGDDVTRVALATGIVAVLAAVTLALLLVVGGPFGRANDVLNAAIGLMSAVLAVVVYRSVGGSAALVALAVVGAAITVIGSWLVMTGTTGFQLAGFVSAIGFALIGAWLVGSIVGPFGDSLSPLQSRVGMAAGGLMLVGLIGIGGVAMGIDSAADTPWWLWMYGIGWLGTYVVYPAWCLLLARST